MSESPGSVEERVSVLVGDRLCTGCGYNLTGQPVVREGHYRLLIVRCPECGAVASVQEYPLLGRWAGRWAMALAAAWFLCALVLLVGTAGVLTAGAFSVSNLAARPLVIKVNGLQQERFQTMQQSGTAPIMIPPQITSEEIDVMVSGAGGWAKASAPGALLVWTMVGPLGFAIGCVLATFFTPLRPRWLLVLGLAVTLLAAVFMIMADASNRASYGVYDWGAASRMVMDRIGPPYRYGTLAFSFLCLAAGLWLGRRITRGLIRALLSPRLSGALALLWIADGLEPPGTRRSEPRDKVRG